MKTIIREFFQDAKTGAEEFLSVYRALPRQKRAILNVILVGWFVVFS